MNFAETFIRRPVATTLLVLTILIFGIMGYFRLPVADLPTVDYPVIQVNANLPGANPDTMASSVATPLEKQFATISGITAISSRSSQGSTNISLTFDLDRNIDSAAQDVQTAIARSSRGAAAGHADARPRTTRAIPTDMPVLFLTLTSDTLPMAQVDRYAETVLAQRLSMVTGVAQVNVFGAQKYAVRVDLDPTQLAARQIGIDQVTQAINGPTSTGRPARFRPEPELRRAVERPADVGGAVPPDRRRLSQRQPGAAGGSRARLRRRREPAQRQLVQRQAGALPRHPAPARAPTRSKSSIA